MIDGCLLDYNYYNKHYEMMAINLSKQQVPAANPKAMQQINFTGNLGDENNRVIFFITKEAKQTILEETVKVF